VVRGKVEDPGQENRLGTAPANEEVKPEIRPGWQRRKRKKRSVRERIDDES
jgi:hypothetical protein